MRIQGLKQIYNEGRKGGKKTKKKLPPLPGLTAEMSEQLPEHVHQLMRLVGARGGRGGCDGRQGHQHCACAKGQGSVQGKRDGDGGGGGGNNEDENENEDEESDVAANAALKQLVHLQINTPAEDKDIYAYYYLQANANKRVLIFVNSIKTSRLDGLLRALNLNCRVIHAQLQQKQRIKALESFQQSPSGILVATDAAARGLDIVALRRGEELSGLYPSQRAHCPR